MKKNSVPNMPVSERASIAQAPSNLKSLPPTPRNFRNVSADIKKVAVTMPERDAAGQKNAQLIEFNQTLPLESIIQGICAEWNLEDISSYALRFNETNQKMYITEKNRKDIQNGQVLNLTLSAGRTAKTIKQALSGSRLEDKNSALRSLSYLSSDITFSEEFVKIQGHILLIDIVTGGNYKGDPLSYTLKSFVSIMEHGIVSWEILDQDFIRKVAECVNVSANNLDTQCLQSALDILESVVLYCSGKQNVIEQVVTPVNVIPHLESKSQDVQKNAIALINALFTKADESKRKKIAESLQSQKMRNNILSNVIRGGTNVGSGMAHELYVLQTLLLNLNEDRMRKGVDIHDPAINREIEELRRIAFDVEGDPNINTVRKSQNSSKEYKKLGFENANPIEDFVAAPPGILALDVMLYFARNHGENYVKVVLENCTREDDHDCPFVQASKMLTKILCEILKVGEPPSDDGETYYIMFFTHDKPFEEFFCICIQLLNKTWREMKATSDDFQKVLDVVREQIVRVLDTSPTSFEAFRSKINTLTYAQINRLWETERLVKEGQGAQLKPIIELREQIKPEMMDLIKQQRLKYLTSGSRFAKYTKTGRIKDKFWCWRLAPNYKALHYGDCGESENLSLDDLPNKLPLSDIRKLLVGKDCPHINTVKTRSKLPSSNTAFSIQCDMDTDPICFMASSENEFDMWTDGLNSLLGNEMTSGQVGKDLETLLSMEIKMRMLDTEGVPIPAEAPPIPPPPANYNFTYLNL